MVASLVLHFWMAASSLAQAAEVLYPDLIAWPKPGAYMYDAEVVIVAGRKRLRFSSAPTNVGRGPFELRGRVEPDGTTSAFQRVYSTDGSFTERPAGTFSFAGHADHNHFHFGDFADYYLRAVTAFGGVGAIAARSDKVAFAMWDIDAYDLGLPGAPRRPFYQRPEGQVTTQGISVGWADVYSKTLEDQDIDITGIPDGDYWLEVVIDPRNKLVESNDANNASRLRIRLVGAAVSILPDGGQPTPTPTTVNSVRPFPNPWDLRKHRGLPLKFGPLVEGAIVRIFSVSGRSLRTLSTSGSEAVWDLADAAGTQVASGFYLYVVDDGRGNRRRGIFAVVR